MPCLYPLYAPPNPNSLPCMIRVPVVVGNHRWWAIASGVVHLVVGYPEMILKWYKYVSASYVTYKQCFDLPITTVRGAEPAAWRGDDKRRWVEVTKSGMQKPHDFHFEAVAERAPRCSSFNCTSYTRIQAFILFRIHTHILSTHIYFILYLLYAVLEVAASKYSPVRLFWCVCWFKINRRSSHHCQRTYR